MKKRILLIILVISLIFIVACENIPNFTNEAVGRRIVRPNQNFCVDKINGNYCFDNGVVKCSNNNIISAVGCASRQLCNNGRCVFQTQKVENLNENNECVKCIDSGNEYCKEATEFGQCGKTSEFLLQCENRRQLVSWKGDCPGYIKENINIPFCQGKSDGIYCKDENTRVECYDENEMSKPCGNGFKCDNGECVDNSKCFNGRGTNCGGICYTISLNGKCINNEKWVDSTNDLCENDKDCINSKFGNFICDTNDNVCAPFKNYLSFKFNIPKSVPANKDVSFTIEVKNELSYPKEIKLNGPVFTNVPHASSMTAYHYESNEKNSFWLDPGESKILTYNIVTGPKGLFNQIFISTEDYLVGSTYLMTYDEKEFEICNSLKYNKGFGICQDNIFYPVGKLVDEQGDACKIDSDCIDTYHNNGKVCHEYLCIDKPEFHYLGNNKNYIIPIVPIYLSSGELREIQKTQTIDEFKTIINDANNFVQNEKSKWSNKDFNVRWEFRDYDIQDIIENEQKFNLPASAGLNFRKFITTGGNRITGEDQMPLFPIIVHETFHSFGMFDLYHYNGEYSSKYYHADCNLFKADWDFFKQKQKLCPLEAWIIGFDRPSVAGTAG